MHAVKRRFEDCPACENRGVICDYDFPCPLCNAMCPFCLEQPVTTRSPQVGRSSPLCVGHRRGWSCLRAICVIGTNTSRGISGLHLQ